MIWFTEAAAVYTSNTSINLLSPKGMIWPSGETTAYLCNLLCCTSTPKGILGLTEKAAVYARVNLLCTTKGMVWLAEEATVFTGVNLL